MPCFFQLLGTDGGKVHHAAGLVLAAQIGAHGHVAVKSFLHHGIVDLDIVRMVPKVVLRQ